LTGTQALAMDDMDNNVTANGKRRNEHGAAGDKVRYTLLLRLMLHQMMMMMMMMMMMKLSRPRQLRRSLFQFCPL